MENTYSDIERFVIRLAATFSRRVSRETAEIYAQRLAIYQFTPIQFDRILRKIQDEMELWPPWAIMKKYCETERIGTQSEVVPIFKTWRDSEGRPWAKDTGRYQTKYASNSMLDAWRRDACTTQEGLILFRQAFMSAGGNPCVLVVGAPLPMINLPTMSEVVEEEVPF